MGIEDAYNFRRIDDLLTTSGFVTAEQLRSLRGEGYDAVINLLPDDNDRALAGEGEILREQGVEYVHIPVDFDEPTHADFAAFSDAMDARNGQKIHVHCAANYRVSAFCSLYVRNRGLRSDVEADRLVEEIWNPADFPAWAAFITDERW
jgi:protein tyrosine phosphatase (PTP) superfamily phosphohydrolase (DUF442 family)